MDIDIFYRSNESGCAWYVWQRSSMHIYSFSSMEKARRFAGLLACANTHAECVDASRSLEQAATLI